MEVTSPTLFARIPRSPVTDGVAHVGSVWGVRDEVRRKRQEIAVAVDGHSVNIYEILNGRVVSSYLVSPLCLFTCPPTSARISENGRAQRKTYCAKWESRPYITCISEGVGKTTTPSIETSAELPGQQHIMSLDICSFGGLQKILALQKDGMLIILNSDLQTILLQQELFQENHEQIECVAAAFLNLPEARRSVLKHRQDLVQAASETTAIIVVAYHHTEGDTRSVYAAVWAVDTKHDNTYSTSITPLIKHKIQEYSSKESVQISKHRSCVLTTHAARLHVKSSSGFSIYDLTTLVPRLVSNGPPGVGAYHDSLMISDTSVMAVFPDSLQVYDINFGTLQLQKDLSDSNLRKRKQRDNGDSITGLIKFVAFFSKAGRIIVQRRNQLLALDLQHDSSGKTRFQPPKFTLGDAVGRGLLGPGMSTKDFGGMAKSSTLPSSATEKEWNQWREVVKQLETCTSPDGAEKFEQTFLEHVTVKFCDSGSEVNLIFVPDYQINYILGSLFALQLVGNDRSAGQIASPSISLKFLTARLITALAHAGLLTTQRVLAAIVERSGIAPPRSMPADALTQSLIDADPTYSLLLGYLQNVSNISQVEKAAAVRLLLRRTLQESDRVNTTLISSARLLQSSGVEAESDQSNSAAISETHPNLTSESQLRLLLCFIPALNQFGQLSSAAILANLHLLYTKSDALALIQLLRQQLFQGGHTTLVSGIHDANPRVKTVESTIPETELEPSAVRLDAAINLLSGCVDLLGPFSTINSLNEEEGFLETVVSDLCSEITRIMIGMEEVTQMQGVLRETLRYADSLHFRPTSTQPVRMLESGLPQQEPGVVITLFSGASESDSLGQDNAMLPLSLQGEKLDQLIKVRKGGGQVSLRSRREIKARELRAKGPYSFERLVL